jgi:hypothetical protein
VTSRPAIYHLFLPQNRHTQKEPPNRGGS